MLRTNSVYSLLVCLAILGGRETAFGQANDRFVEKKVGDVNVRLPIIDKFTASCEENQAYRKRVSGLVPESHLFLTCLSDSKDWEVLKAGHGSYMSSIIIVSTERQQHKTPWTPKMFEQLKAAGRERLKGMIEDKKDALQSARKQDEASARMGQARTTTNYENTVNDFYEVPNVHPNFSVETSRSYTVAENNEVKQYRELTCVSTVYYRGQVILAIAILNGQSTNNAALARQVITTWMTEFAALNR